MIGAACVEMCLSIFSTDNGQKDKHPSKDFFAGASEKTEKIQQVECQLAISLINKTKLRSHI
ncbi:hypothetical protein WH50_06260 [Pokkaliibacter plantistimulans]|uniref:Uncharacterized protein n=1 Tax=Pokkaliibacter plantistimulans TaxID=1635171 RepID=A0ABX5M2D9_9GAMM|nr:hypothetical protein WH50_06260 [Pokkaliibacter plantistimulans]